MHLTLSLAPFLVGRIIIHQLINSFSHFCLQAGLDQSQPNLLPENQGTYQLSEQSQAVILQYGAAALPTDPSGISDLNFQVLNFDIDKYIS